MRFNATPANDTALPVITHLGETRALSHEDLAGWCADIGRTTADVLAIMFKLPARPSIVAMFEAEMREEVGAAIDATTHATDEERHRLTNVAWIAFDQRLAIHHHQRPFAGRRQT